MGRPASSWMSFGVRDFMRVPRPAAMTTAATFGDVPGLGGFTRSDASGRGSGRSRSRRGQGPARVEVFVSSKGSGDGMGGRSGVSTNGAVAPWHAIAALPNPRLGRLCIRCTCWRWQLAFGPSPRQNRSLEATNGPKGRSRPNAGAIPFAARNNRRRSPSIRRDVCAGRNVGLESCTARNEMTSSSAVRHAERRRPRSAGRRSPRSRRGHPWAAPRHRSSSGPAVAQA
jgi:hypothetical protein